MKKVRVQSGICGFATVITAEMVEGKKVAVKLESECEMVSKMAGDLTLLDRMVVFSGFLVNPVYVSASKHLKHVTCPVPSGILKAVEAEAGFSIAKDAKIEFVG